MTGTLDATNDVKLYEAKLPVAADTKLQLVYKRGASGVASAVQVAVSFTDAPASFIYLSAGTTTTNAWNKIEFSLGAYAGKTIAVLGLRLSNATAISGYDVRVGRLAVYDGVISAPAPPTGFVINRQDSPDADTLSLRLKWTHSTSPISCYNVYLRYPDSTRSWLGATPNNALYIPAARRKALETTLNLEVEAVGLDYGVSTRALATDDPAGTQCPIPAHRHGDRNCGVLWEFLEHEGQGFRWECEHVLRRARGGWSVGGPRSGRGE